MTVRQVKIGDIIQCIRRSNDDNHPRTKVGDKFSVDGIDHGTVVKGHRLSDNMPLVILGDTGAKHFRILQPLQAPTK